MASGPVVGFSCWFEHWNDQCEQNATENEARAQQHEIVFLAGFQTFVFSREHFKVVANLLVLFPQLAISTFQIDGIGGDTLDPLKLFLELL